MPLKADESVELMVLERIKEFGHPGNSPARVLSSLVSRNLVIAPDDCDGIWELGEKANYYLGYLRNRNRGQVGQDADKR